MRPRTRSLAGGAPDRAPAPIQTLALATLALATLTAAPLAAQRFHFMAEQTREPSLPPLAGTGLRTMVPVAGDYDRDGRIDIAFATQAGLVVYRNLGAGRYAGALTGPATPTGALLRPLDFDGDGDTDLTVVSGVDVRILRNNGAGAFTAGPTAPFSGGFEAVSLAIGDVDGDGDDDLVRASGGVVALLRSQDPALVQTTLWTTTALTAGGVSLADFDGDGDLDLATTVLAATNQLVLLENDGTGAFTRSATFAAAATASAVAVVTGDLDGDGDRDLVAVRPAACDVLWNDGAGVFTAGPQLRGLMAASATIADLDEDGAADLLLTGLPGLALFVGDGAGNFTDTGASRWGGPPAAIADTLVQDYDGDGDLDCGCFDVLGFVPFSQLLVNHARQLVSAQALQPGGPIELDRYSGPGFGPPGLSLLAAGLALPPAPIVVGGVDGGLELDPALAVVVDVAPTSAVGVSTWFGAVPGDPGLVGLDVFFQLAVLPATAAPGFGNCVIETVRP